MDDIMTCPRCGELSFEAIDDVDGFCTTCQEYLPLPIEEECDVE